MPLLWRFKLSSWGLGGLLQLISIPQEDWREFWLAFRRKSISENTQLQLIALSLGVWPEVRGLFSDSVALVLLTLFSKMLFSLYRFIPVTFDFPVRLNYQYTSTPLYFCSFISTSSRYHTNQYTYLVCFLILLSSRVERLVLSESAWHQKATVPEISVRSISSFLFGTT